MDVNTNKTGSTILKEWTTPDFKNTLSTTNLEGEGIVDAPGKDENASMPEQVKQPNPWKKKKKKKEEEEEEEKKKKKKKKKRMMMMMMMMNACEMLCVRITLI
jgi:hypothetical protein